MSWAAAALVLFLQGASLVGAAAPPHSGKAPRPASHPFDPKALRVPIGFKGTPISSFFQSLTVPGRNEYESKSAYEARAAAFRAVDRPMVAFVFSEDLVTGPHYDADSEEFTLLVRTEHPDVNGQSAPDATIVRMPIASSRVVGRSYSASNAFGAKAVVKKVTDTCYAAILPAGDIVRPYTITVRVPVPPGDVSRLKSSMRLLLVCKPSPAPDAVVPRHELFEPTFQNPVEGSSSDVLIACNAASLWAFDESTGRVLTKVALEDDVVPSLSEE